MHQPIQDHLETYLSDSGNSEIPPEFHAHLAACPSCASSVRALSLQSSSLRALRAPGLLEPRGDLYARVMIEIEGRKTDSFWSPFLDPFFGRGVAFGCGALVLLFGTYLVGVEPREHRSAAPGILVTTASGSAFDGDGSAEPRQRDAVLATLTSFRE